jgi:alkaline phosphatase D
MTISRRELLRRAGAFGMTSVVVVVSGCPGADDDFGDDLPHYEYEGEPGPADLFQHGVASGDPLTDSVILWTRVTDPSSSGPIEAFVEVALDPQFERRVAATPVVASADRDHTVKVDLEGLEPGTTYYYRFFALGRESSTGRTRTAPEGAVDRLRFVFCSCSSLAHGWFHAYRRIAERADLDFVVHLGDYIYEYGNGKYGDVRAYEPEHDIVTLEDYRTRYAQYRRDPDLQAAHQQHPFIVVWDDHESADNSWRDGAHNHSDASQGDWETRKQTSIQVYMEWLPVREGVHGVIYRMLPFGDLVDLIMLDTRLVGRDEPASNVNDTDTIEDPNRSILGAEQEAWLEERMRASQARWQIIGQQVMMGQLQLVPGTPLNLDQWDGYAASRDRFFATIDATHNVVVLTGDIHTSWAIELAPDPFDPEAYNPETGAGAVAVEFVTPAISSPGLASNLNLNLPHVKWVDVVERGYVIVDVTHQRVQADWFHVADVTSPQGDAEVFANAFTVAAGERQLVQASTPVPDRPDAPALARSPEASLQTTDELV